MFKYLSSLIWGNSDTLSLDEAFKVLEDNNENICQKETTLDTDNQFDEEYAALGRTGYITDTEDDTFTIDNQFKFKSDSPYFHVGTKVSYSIVLSMEGHKVSNVSVVENDWDVVVKKTSNWCMRTIICKVDVRNGRKLKLNPGNIDIDLNEVSSEFVPLVGDWIQLEARCELDQEIVDLNGKILDILKICPLRPQIKVCNVSSWDLNKNEGILDNTIYFNKDSLSGGYLPLRNDKVIAEFIESEQGRCASRALKVIPDFLKTVKNFNSTQIEIEPKIEGVLIEKPDCLKYNKLKEANTFSVFILNERNEDIVVKNVEFPKTNSQCKILSDIHKDVVIYPKERLEISCECVCVTMGKTKEYLSVSTNLGDINEWIDIEVEAKTAVVHGSYSHRSKGYVPREKYDIIKGQRISAPPRFIAVKCLDYTLPKRFLEVIQKHSTTYVATSFLREELLEMKPCLGMNLTFNNYLDRFHTLLYFEEVQNVIDISAYDQNRCVFIRNNEFLMMEIENLSERRPSIIVGDKVFAKDSYGHNNTNWEGFVHKVGAKHVYIKFSTVFHDSYNGEDYEIHVVSSRTSIRRLHQAIDLAVKNLGPEVLFSSKLNLKEPQVYFQCAPEDCVENSAVKSPNPGSKLKKLLEYKNKSLSERKEYFSPSVQKEHGLKLEWYNKTLNFYQKEAVKNVLRGEARPLPYFIFGPPGTGKTVTLVECVLQILRLMPFSRLLISAPSNSAADLMTFRLIESKVLKPGDLVRYVSHKYAANLPAALAPFSATGNLSKEGTNTRSSTVLENGLTLGSTGSVLGRHRITVTTCSSAGALYTMGFPKDHFSHILIDEAGQAMEPEVMIPLVFLDVSSGQAVLAGDPLQLGPVIMSKIADEFGLHESYVERLLNRFPYAKDPIGFPNTGGYDPRLVTKLLCNYRSLPGLLKLTSLLFYNDDLIPMLSDENKDTEEVSLLEKLNEILPRNNETGKIPNIIFHGINGENYQTPDSPSWFNPSEASQVFFYVNELYRLGLKCADIGIISPYVKQVKEIRALLTEAEFDLPKIGSVEEFQGQEFNVVILSTVRSTQNHVAYDIKHSLGFISSPRRLNVALSRARILLIIIGNPNLLYGDKYWQSIINYTMKNALFVGCGIESMN